jgi:predicted nucleic-acid-binding protein
MIAVDTNIVVRLAVNDDPQQTSLAAACVAQGAFVSHGVLMETEWVLRTAYGFPRDQIADVMLDFLDLECIVVDQRDDLRWATERYREGADWADLLHLIAARGHAAFVTFDRALPRQAGARTPTKIEILK